MFFNWNLPSRVTLPKIPDWTKVWPAKCDLGEFVEAQYRINARVDRELNTFREKIDRLQVGRDAE